MGYGRSRKIQISRTHVLPGKQSHHHCCRHHHHIATIKLSMFCHATQQSHRRRCVVVTDATITLYHHRIVVVVTADATIISYRCRIVVADDATLK